MTPKEKAQELVYKFYWRETVLKCSITDAKQCALIAVNAILLTLNKDIRDLDVVGNVLLDLIEYWNQVEQEIENL